MTALDEYRASLLAFNAAEGLPRCTPWRWVRVMRARIRHSLAVRALARSRETPW